MTICLYECLKAAGLQHHYDGFTLVGVCHAAHLPALRMEDYPLLGVHSMEDRTRLFHLVQMVKTLDLKSLANDENVCDGGDEDHPAGDGRFSSDGYGNLGDDLSEDQTDNKTLMQSFSFARPTRTQRRLKFTAESSPPAHVYSKHNKNNLPFHRKELATSMQHKVFSRNLVPNGHRESQNDKLNVFKRLHDCQNEEQLQITRGSSVFKYDVSLLPKSKTSHKRYPSPVTMPFKTFNKSFGLESFGKRLSKRKSYSTCMTNPIPVYEAKRTAGYNYGLPLSSPHVPNNKHAGKQRISVCVRKRPLTCAEGRRGETDVVTTPGGDCVVVHESKEAVDLTEYILQHRFYFDHVFGEESSNEEVYRKTTFPLVQHMLSGGKATCFAYGQTGAGKTYTMLGFSSGGPGLYALAAQDIFAHLSTTQSHYSPQLVYVSFFEIYCGQLYDLLDHRKRLFAREDGQKVVHISGLRNVRVDSVNSLLEVISQGTAERTQGTSGVNPRSSRSHALLQIQLRGLNPQTAGRMCFVDLAGSERASDSKEPDRQTRMEGAEINQSLLALKECIRSLDKEESHTPFRQSKLTQVLKDSFVGDSVTCMIANISPGHQATEHTLNTLRYADRVKELKGQGEKKRCETRPSSKHNVSNSNKSQSNVGALIKHKLKKQSASFSPNTSAVKLHTEDTFLCSTPKNSRCEQKTQSRNRREIGPERITPIRSWLANDDAGRWSKRADVKEDRTIENVKYGSCNSVREKSTRAALVNEQQTKQHRNKDEAIKGCLPVAKVESGFHLREKEMSQIITKEGRKEQMKSPETRGKTESLYKCRRNEEEEQRKGETLKDDNKEKMKRLRQYHQQLQQFLPSSASSSVHLQSSSTCPSFSSSVPSLLHSSCLSNLSQMDHNLKGFSNVYTDRVEVYSRRQIPSVSAQACLQNESSSYCMKNYVDAYGSYGGVRKGRKVGKRESERKRLETGEEHTRREPKRCSQVAEEESANGMTGALPTNTSSQLFCSWDSEDRGDLSVEELDASDAPDNGVWSIGQVEAADYYSLQTAHSSNESNSHFGQTPFELQHQRAPAERPLSPGNENAIAVGMSDNLENTCHKSNKQDCNILVLPFQNIQEAASSNGASRKTFSCVQPVPTTMTESFNKWLERPVPTKSGTRQDFKAKIPILPQGESYLESLSCTMDPLSRSLLHVDQQPATASFLQGHISNGENTKRETGEESLSSVEMERSTVEDEDAKFHLSLLEILHPMAPATSDTPWFALMSLCDQENSQKNKQTCHQTPLMSLPIHNRSFAVCKPPDHEHNKHKTQQLANVPGHLNIVHSNQSSISNVSPKPSDQENNSNLQIKPAIHLVTMNSLNNAKWCVVEAHLEQLKEVKALCHKEGKLLCQQHDMAFGEYVHKLAEILEKKAKCVHSMRAQLQPYLKSILSNHHTPTQEDNHHPVV